MKNASMSKKFQAPYRLIIGLGTTGLSIARYFTRKKQNFVMADTRPHPPHAKDFLKNFPDVPTFFEKMDESLLLQADEIILSPGISLENPLLKSSRARGISLIGDIELFVREAKAPIIDGKGCKIVR